MRGKFREEIGKRRKLPSPVTVSPCHQLPRCSVRTSRLLSLFSSLSALAASATRPNTNARVPTPNSNSRPTINNDCSSPTGGGDECARRYRCFPSLYQKPRVCLFPRHSETRTLVGGEKEEGEKKVEEVQRRSFLKGQYIWSSSWSSSGNLRLSGLI